MVAISICIGIWSSISVFAKDIPDSYKYLTRSNMEHSGIMAQDREIGEIYYRSFPTGKVYYIITKDGIGNVCTPEGEIISYDEIQDYFGFNKTDDIEYETNHSDLTEKEQTTENTYTSEIREEKQKTVSNEEEEIEQPQDIKAKTSKKSNNIKSNSAIQYHLGEALGDISMGNHPLAPYASSSVIVPRPAKSQYSAMSKVAGNTNFSDIRGHWAESYIKRFAAEGYISGDPNGKFRPDDAITYAEFAAITARFQLKPVRFHGGFNDVELFSLFSEYDVYTWYHQPVLIASEAGVFGNSVEIGFDAGNNWLLETDDSYVPDSMYNPNTKSIYRQFEPEDSAKRQYISVFLANLLEYKDTDLNNGLRFSDLSRFNTYSDKATEKAVKRLVVNGIVTGFPDNTFRPEGTVTRAEMVVMLTKLLDKYNWNMDNISNNLYGNYHQFFWNESEQLLDLVNDARRQEGISTLKYSPDVAALAEIHVIDKITNGYESGGGAHKSQTYQTQNADEFGKKFGFTQYVMGENALGGSVNAQTAHTRWTNSPEHKKNYLKQDYDYAGFAIGETVSMEMFAIEK